jgi:hypothetical protein
MDQYHQAEVLGIYACGGLSFDIMKKDVKLVRLIRMSMIVQKYIGLFLATNLPSNLDGLGDRHGNGHVCSK